MLDRLGPVGIVGVVVMLVGIALVAWQDPIVAAGIALVIVGLGMVVKALVSALFGAMGMGGMV